MLYTFLYTLAVIILFPKEYFKRPKEIRKRWIGEKLGFLKNTIISHTSASSPKPKVWIHSVSVGEVIAVSKIIKKLSEQYEIILSTVTDTGQKVAFERFRDYTVKVIYLPFDIPFAIKRALRNFSPKALILTETEIWPNLIYFSSKKIPVFLVNGRLSEKSFKGYFKIKFFIEPLLKKFSLICVQDEKYKERFIKLGAEEEKLHITGNMKFDIEIKEIPFVWENSIPKPVVIAGSTHAPEEEIVLNAFFNLGINGTLIVAPRHPERFSEVEVLIRKRISESKRTILFSKLSEINSDLGFFSIVKEKPHSSVLIMLVDQIGILGSLYRVCDVAIIGGSFIPHGGQNPLEPAYWRKPIICGPYMHNFPFINEFIRENACIMTDKERLKDNLKKILKSPDRLSFIGDKAYKIFSKKSGATERTLLILEKFI